MRFKVTILEPVQNRSMTITIDKLIKHFKLPYANTYDSVQGLSLSKKNYDFLFAIYHKNYFDRCFFMWIALRRKRDLKIVQVFKIRKKN